MALLRRYAIFLCALVGIAALAPATVLAATGDLAAGTYSNNSIEAALSFYSPTDGSGLNIDVNQRVDVARPTGGVSTTTRSTTINIQAFGSFSGFGCYNLSPGEFTFDGGLTGATLRTTVTDTTTTCDGQPGQIPTPFTVAARWTGNGPVTTSQQLMTEVCLDYRVVSTFVQKNAPQDTVAVFTPFFPDPLTTIDGGVLRPTSRSSLVTGPTHDTCPEQPGAVAGGAGPLNAGDYTTVSKEANVSVFTDTLQFGVDLVDNIQYSKPITGPTTISHEKDVRLTVFSGGQYGAGCFVLKPSDYSFNGVKSAAINATFTSATPTCDGLPATIPLPQTLNVVWTQTRPVSNFRFVGSFVCLTYQGKSVEALAIDHPDVTATLTPFLPDPITTDQGTLMSTTQQQHAAGAKQPACHI
jgi:hypothetical protein